MSKRLIIFSTICILFLNVVAQNKSIGNIAPFKIRLVNGEGFTHNQLVKGKPVILIYFTTTCDHCKSFTKALTRRLDKLQDRQVVMISFEHINAVKNFNDYYGLSRFNNIKVGSEGYTFVVQKYYKIEDFPFVAEYDKAGKLKKIISWNSKPEEMAEQLY